MSADEYSPSDEDIEQFYVLGRIEYSPGSDIAPASARNEFRTLLARVRREAKAEAWDEGYMAGAHDEHEHRPAAKSCDPTESRAEFNRWLERIETNAARRALTDYAGQIEDEDPEWTGVLDTTARVRDIHDFIAEYYPEETQE